MITVTNLSKHFDSFVAVNSLNFEVKTGEVMGFLGPNGAGKSTTMKMLTCFLPPTSGTATICGHDILQDSIEVRKCIGYLAETGPLYDEMLVYDFLKFIASLRGLDNIKEKIDRVVKLCALEEAIFRTVSTLSKGYRRRVGLAQAIIHDPQVLILDEPTDGLDPNQKHDIHGMIRSMAKKKCILLSTHILDEVESICDRAMVISRGSIKATGTPADLCKLAPSTADKNLANSFRQLTLNG